MDKPLPIETMPTPPDISEDRSSFVSKAQAVWSWLKNNYEKFNAVVDFINDKIQNIDDTTVFAIKKQVLFGTDSSTTANKVVLNIADILHLENKMTIFFTVANTNTGDTTININNLGEKPLKEDGQNLTDKRLQKGESYIAVYNEDLSIFELKFLSSDGGFY